jgi:arylsulfatase A-like enzyme
MPTLLDACGVEAPEGVQGRSYLPLVRRDPAAIESWQEETFVQISESGTGRAIRSERWTYSVAAPAGHGASHAPTGPQALPSNLTPGSATRVTGSPSSEAYVETHLYDNYADPFQHTNLLGRAHYRDTATRLRERLLERMTEAGERAPEIQPFSGQTPP